MSSEPHEKQKPVSLMVSAGDISADKHTGKLIEQLKLLKPDLHVWGLGSSSMRSQGAEILFDCQEFSSIGIVGILKHIPFLAKLREALLLEMEKRQPAAVLLVDYGGFNLVLAEAIRARFKKLPIYYFISPQVWGSRPWRINTIARTVSKMFVIFPFEENIYAKKNVPVTFVGHPLTKNLPDSNALMDRQEFSKKYNFDSDKKIIAIFPGSRKSEIKNLFPITLEACRYLGEQRPDIQFAISQANDGLAADIAKAVQKDDAKYPDQQIKLISPQDTYSLMSVCDLAWAKSGTTTLELTLFAKPMLIFYRGDWLSYLVFLAFKRTQRVGWPNLLAGKELVPELLQLDCCPDKLVQYSQDWLDVPGLRVETASALKALKDKLGEGNYAQACANEIAEQLAEAN